MIISIIPAAHKVIVLTLSEDPLFSVNTLLKHLLASPKEHLFKNYVQFHAAYAFSWLVIVNWYAHISCSCVSGMPIFHVPVYLVCPYFTFPCIWYAHISCYSVSGMPIFHVPVYLLCPYLTFPSIWYAHISCSHVSGMPIFHVPVYLFVW